MKLRSFAFFFGLLITCSSFAQTHRDEFGIQTDNDSYLFNGSDRYYTNGLFFYYDHALSFRKDSTTLQNKILGFELGQKMYNSQGGSIPAAIYDDRPFAGYLYIAGSLNWLYRNESNFKITAQLGVVGPASLAQAVQQWTHTTFGLYKISGWQFQIKNDPEVNFTFEYNKLLVRNNSADISLSSYADVGTGFTGIGVGPLIRLGAFNQLFHSQTTRSGVIADDDIKPLHTHEFFVYYKPQVNIIAYNATIEGGLFTDHSDEGQFNDNFTGEIVRTIEPVVFSQQIGAIYSTGPWTYDLSVIAETKDTQEMVHSGHTWGAILVLYKFK